MKEKLLENVFCKTLAVKASVRALSEIQWLEDRESV